MYGPKVKLRFFFVLLILLTFVLSTFLILKSLEENVIYFQSPSEIKVLSEIEKKKIRVGGMVKINSISEIPLGHKIALLDLKEGDTILKYGHDIGKVIKAIKKGDHVHVHNVKTKKW